MKNNFLKKVLTIAALLVTTVTLWSCQKELEAPYIDKGFVTFKGNGSFDQMTPVPITASTGTATFIARYDINLRILNYTLNWKELSSSVTRADFYFPNDGVQNGWLVRNIVTAATPRPATDSIAGYIWSNTALSDKELEDLKAGRVYYTITTSSNTGGEIRGQITVK